MNDIAIPTGRFEVHKVEMSNNSYGDYEQEVTVKAPTKEQAMEMFDEVWDDE